jgi:hypothetical protein
VNEILSKISSYNIFNYLFPGAVFMVASERLGIVKMPDLDIVTKLLVYYSVGLMISRIGSLVLEPVLRWTKIVTYSDYDAYIIASERDKKIEAFIEASNTLRTIAAGAMCLMIAWLISGYLQGTEFAVRWGNEVTIAFFFILFVLAHRKQSSYVFKRVQHYARPGAPP